MMQCGGAKCCPWPRVEGHTSCCHKCRKTRGAHHAKYCISRIQNANTRNTNLKRRKQDGDHGRDRAPTPRRELSANIQSSQGNQAARCVVCLAANVTHALVPCGHMCVCEECSSIVVGHMTKCPMCRVHVQRGVRIYLS